jgi:hypothetical protein
MGRGMTWIQLGNTFKVSIAGKPTKAILSEKLDFKTLQSIKNPTQNLRYAQKVVLAVFSCFTLQAFPRYHRIQSGSL